VRRVLIVEPDDGLRSDLLRVLRSAGYEADAEREAAEERIAGGGYQAAILDVSSAGLVELERLAAAAPDLALVVTGAEPSVALAVEAMKRGARDFLRKPFDVRRLEAALDAVFERDRCGCAAAGVSLRTEDPAMQRLLAKAEAAAVTEATVQIVGESGTGKDLLARFVHLKSARRSGPFVVVNCAALAESLWESELFGVERGVFPGAMESRPGRVAAADAGTLLLDEVSEVALSLQPKLLRVLQEREVHPVGGLAARRVDVRILSTTQRDLRAEVEARRFREDLYYRLDVIVLGIPPLRERPADIRLLARSFLERFAEANGKEPPLLHETSLRKLVRHPFPGNVRELENLMRRAVLLHPGREIDVDRLLGRRGVSGDAHGVLRGSLNLRELQRRAILRSLAHTGGNRTEASRQLGISVRTLRNKIRQYGLR
jgi:two-component system response regulator HydG